MFDPIGGQDSRVRRGKVFPLVTSLTIHAAAVTLLLALTFSTGITARPLRTRMVTLLTPLPPAVPVARPAFIAPPRRAPRLFLAPAMRRATAPPLETPPIPALQIPLPEVARAIIPTVEVAHLAVVERPPLRIDNLKLLAAPDPLKGWSAIVSRPAGFTAATFAAGRGDAVIRPSGFERIAVGTPRRERAPPLAGAGFGDATITAAAVPSASLANASPITRSVEIMSKPRPVYTEEARRQRIEGEVLLEILFAASGEVRVLGTVRGLGHGLDESAITAAEAIRFRPAERLGVVTDSTAIVHIVFQLAY
ncbi:MAG: energy transducer TonB [Acidobacteriota bacterium]